MAKTTNKKQLDVLLSAMQQYPDIARGFFKGSKEELNRVWRNLEAELNAAGPPSKSIAEWKKVWCDQKKYVRHKAAQNLKLSKGTGGGPNMEQKFSANEEAIYNLISMKESVEGMAKTFGLGSSITIHKISESLPPELLELVADDVVVENSVDDNELDMPQKPPAKKMRLSAQKEANTHVSPSDVLAEEICIQRKRLEVMMEQQQNTKKIYRSIDRHYDIKKEELKEQKRHNIVMEKLRLREVEDKIEKNRRLLEIEDLKHCT